jgi:branched-chain amino acid transport system permease protein
VTTLVQIGVDALSLGSLYALFALGLALIFGIMGLINFAHGELIMAAAYVAVVFAGTTELIVVPVAIVAAALLALVMERVAFRPLRGSQPETLLVASFAISIMLQSTATLAFGSLQRSAGIFLSLGRPWDVFGVRVRGLDVVTVSTTAVLLIALTLFLRKTPMGVQMRASAEDFEAARLLGVRANQVIAWAFVISGSLAGFAAMILVAQTGIVSPTIGLNPVLAGFVAVILGGLGTLLGAVAGAYVLGVLTVLLQVYLPDSLRAYRDAFVFAVLVGILMARPRGLFGLGEQRV